MSTGRGDLPVVAVVGRPNVGKSTLFNRFVGRRQAIVDDTPGVTRDRNFARVEWQGRRFLAVDTGGVIEGSDEAMDRRVRDQALAAMAEADVILLVVDARVGPHPLDQSIAELLRASEDRVIVVANKMDRLPAGDEHLEFWGLGLGEPEPVGALGGGGTGDLLDRVVGLLPAERGGGPEDESEIRVAVIGKPNVGKSSLVNRLFGEERSVVSETPGTTRDPVDSAMTYHARNLRFIDTAGLRRQSRISDSLEYYSRIRTERVVRRADVCLLVVDAADGFHVQDVKIAESAWEAGCGLIVIANKWDLVERDTNSAAAFERAARQKAPFLNWVPFVFTSALTGQRARKPLDLALQVADERHRRIPTAEVNRVLEKLYQRQPPPHHRGRPVRLKYATQADVAPPAFVVFSNYPKAVPDHYIRYMHNVFRAEWRFEGVPIRIRFRASDDQ